MPAASTIPRHGLQEAALAYVAVRDAGGVGDGRSPSVRDEVDRELAAARLVDASGALVRSVVRGRGHASSDREDLWAAARAAVVRAAETYDPHRGPFPAYAAGAVRIAVAEARVRLDRLNRHYRRQTAQVAAARDRAQATLGRTATAGEVATEAGTSADAVRRAEVMGRRRFDAEHDRHDTAEEDSTGSQIVDALTDLRPGPDAALDPAQTAALVRRTCADVLRWLRYQRRPGGALATPETARRAQVTLRSYVLGKTLREIGDDLGVTEARACQYLALARKAIDIHGGGLADELRTLLTP